MIDAAGGAYPDGAEVFCMVRADLNNGKIGRQATARAWDE